jgi:hypothetical protein
MDIVLALAALIILLSHNGVNANEIYINQVGNNLNMEVVQDGEDNYFQYCAVNNDSNCTAANGNQHNWADGVASDNAIVNSETIGDDNTVVVAHATGQNNSNINESNISVTGDRNKVQNFFSNHSNGSNQYNTVDWGGTKESNIIIVGDDNTVKHASDSYGEVDANISVTGDDNDVTVYQRSMRNTANIDVTNAGGPNTINVQQLGSSYQDNGLNSYSLTQYCTNANGCTVNMTQN